MDKKESQFMAALAVSALDNAAPTTNNAKNVVAILNEEEILAERVSDNPSKEIPPKNP